VPQIVIENEMIETKKLVRPDAEWRAPGPAERPSVPSFDEAPELLIMSEPPREIAEVLDHIEAAKETGAEDFIADAVERSSEALGELMKRFPGDLRVERFAVSGRALRAAQYGGLLELVVRLGAAASELLIEKMSAPERDIRFYATICAAELRPRNAVYALVERLFDQDYGVRASAIEALAGYPAQDLSHALARARRAVHSTDSEVVAAATTAIVDLGDVEAIGDLIGALERNDRGSDHVRKALVALTAQDFGGSERKWRKWWEGSRRKHRIEWLIDGLTHKDDAVRENAINQLRRLTGEYFGYHYDLPRREREQAAERWSAWWSETGLRRFVQRPNDDDDNERQERHRPTAQVPLRKD
jgi:HEAT repeat protein